MAHFLWACSTWAIVGAKTKKSGTANHFGQVFTDFQKSIRARWGLTFSITELCFGHQIVNFSPKLAHFLWACSTWAIVWDKTKKSGTANHFGQVFTDFQKSIRARWGLTFSITELCFGHQIVNFSPKMAHFLWACSTWAIVGAKTKKSGTANHFGQVFTNFQKSIRARWGLTFSITELCFGHQIVNFSPKWLIFCGHAPLEPYLGLKQKNLAQRTILDKFLPISKKVSALDEA